MQILLVVNNPANWPLELRGVEVVAARAYLTDPAYNNIRNARVFNLCRSYSYQSLGYYVSLLAEARGHKPQPDILTIQDMKTAAVSRVLTDDLDHLIQSTLRPIRSDRFELSIYFGRTMARRDARLGLRLFGLFPSPLLRAQFVYRDDEWQFQGIRSIPASEIPDNHRDTVIDAAQAYFARGRWAARSGGRSRYDLAILTDGGDPSPPSDEKAIAKFVRAARREGIAAEVITRDDYGRLGEFDALFIRVTTAVDHYTFRFARRAAAEGLAVIDDPVSIARCTNKVYLAERLAQKKVPAPPTVIVHKDNVDAAIEGLGLPVVLKAPDSSFSVGVKKAMDEREYHALVRELLKDSDLIVAQSFTPTDYDWRVGVLDGKPLYACRYFMAHRHWQIMKHREGADTRYGRVETLAVEDAPPAVIRTAVRAARLMGNGLYGVDLKQMGRRVVVIEVNDNPSLEAGYEDRVLRDELYARIMRSFVERIENIRSVGRGNHGR